MRIGILPNGSPSSGGVYQYSQNILHALDVWSDNGCEDHFVLFSGETPPAAAIFLRPDRWEITELEKAPLGREFADRLRQWIGEGPHREAWRWLRRQIAAVTNNNGDGCGRPDPDTVRTRSDLRERLLRCRIEFIVYPYPTTISFETRVPYVIAVHDLQHRLQPEFPEVSADGLWEYREYLFRNGCRNATLILADSEIGKEDILNFYGPYGVTPDRVKVLPYVPAVYLHAAVSAAEQVRIRSLYRLPERYLFYPAQFWPHKNHARIIQALALLKREYGIEAPIVFCGSHSGDIREHAYRSVVDSAAALGISDQIRYLGYIPDEHMSQVYAGAVALVMPTFFGPTNIPVLEAWAFGCPVLTSDIRGIREQVGDAAVLVNPRSVEAIAEGINRLWRDEATRARLKEAGSRRVSSYTADDFRARLVEILEEAKDRVRSGVQPRA